MTGVTLPKASKLEKEEQKTEKYCIMSNQIINPLFFSLSQIPHFEP
jgi:hypothetical protein